MKKPGVVKLLVESENDVIAEISDLWCPEDRRDEQEANARLIAAAPELLSMLKHLLKRANDGADSWNFMVRLAEDLIAKAEGRK